MRTTPPLPLPAGRALAKLGSDLRAARLRRRITMALMAERAFISRGTLQKVEQGDPSVSLGIYATVLFILGMVDRVGALAEPREDHLGMALDQERLPKRVRSIRARLAPPPAAMPEGSLALEKDRSLELPPGPLGQ